MPITTTYFASLDDEDEILPNTSDSSQIGIAERAPADSSLRRVRVAVRCRPEGLSTSCSTSVCSDDDFSETAATTSSQATLGRTCVQIKETNVELSVEESLKVFTYDHAFGPTSSQSDIYNVVTKPVVDGVLQGIHGSILAYGQTGTGKTYTMGILDRVSADDYGIIPGSMRQIFNHIQVSKQRASCSAIWSTTLSFLQIYLESVQDLFAAYEGNSVNQRLQIREHPTKGVYVPNLSEIPVATLSEAVALINMGLEGRNTAATNMNALSSRSHTILTVTISRSECMCGACCGAVRKTKLKLVDLAGSERASSSRTTDNSGALRQREKEARSINVSLSALGKVVAALAHKEDKVSFAHIPFRDSKLTRLLQDTLGGEHGVNTALVATITPEQKSVRETLSTLLFASRCLKVKCEAAAPVISHGSNYEKICESLRGQLKQVTMERDSWKLNFEKAALKPVENDNGGLYEIYKTVIGFYRDYQIRLDDQQTILEKLIRQRLTDWHPLLDPVSKVAVAANLTLHVSHVEDVFMVAAVLAADTEHQKLILHIKIISKSIQMRVARSQELLNCATTELNKLREKGDKLETELTNSSYVLKYLLKSNSQLRQDMDNIDDSISCCTTTSGASQLDRFMAEQKC